MRIIFVLAAAAFLYAGAASAQGWIHYANQQDFFSVNFPGEPVVEEIVYQSEYDMELPARTYSVNDGSTSYKVIVVDYGEASVVDVRGSMAWAAWNYRKQGGEVTFDAYAQVDRIEGHQLQITNADQSRTYIAIHLHNRRLYILEATAPAGLPPPGHFQQSLNILDETGEPIRYDLDADGVRTQVP
jgi:hypothetical protein